jgi:hypothetical protein
MSQQDAGFVALVRDPQGNPKFDDYNNIPQIFWDMLTAEEKAAIIEKRGN